MLSLDLHKAQFNSYSKFITVRLLNLTLLNYILITSKIKSV